MAEVTFPTPAGPRAGYLARAPCDDARPAVVVIHEIFGLNDDIRGLTDRLAGMGYLALAPDFYGGGRWRRCMKAAFKQLKAGEGEFFEAIDAARAWLAADPGSTGAVGVVGFCLGGSFALLAAPRYDFAAASVNYGEVPKDPDVLGGACPVVASYGARDRTTRGRAQRLEGALVANGVEHDVKLYPEAGHGFLNAQPLPPALSVIARVMGMHLGYHAASAEDAWTRVGSFFDAHLRR